MVACLVATSWRRPIAGLRRPVYASTMASRVGTASCERWPDPAWPHEHADADAQPARDGLCQPRRRASGRQALPEDCQEFRRVTPLPAAPAGRRGPQWSEPPGLRVNLAGQPSGWLERHLAAMAGWVSLCCEDRASRAGGSLPGAPAAGCATRHVAGSQPPYNASTFPRPPSADGGFLLPGASPTGRRGASTPPRRSTRRCVCPPSSDGEFVCLRDRPAKEDDACLADLAAHAGVSPSVPGASGSNPSPGACPAAASPAR